MAKKKTRGFRTPQRVFGRKTTFGLIAGDRGFFPKPLVEQGRKTMLDLFKKMDYKAVALSTEDTSMGAVESLEDARKCGALFKEHADEIDGVVVLLSNFGDEKGVANSLRYSGLNVPVLIVAVADDPKQMDAKHRRDSFCGKISVCNNLRQYGIPFSLTGEHTISIDGDEIMMELEWFESVCRVVKGLKGARIGAVGARPAAFNTVRYSEKMLETEGISVETVDLSEILYHANRLNDSDKPVKEKTAALKDYADTSDVPDMALGRMARLAVALEEWINDNRVDALALQCWTSIEENYGVVPCSVMSMLSEAMIPAACEVDVSGAVAMYAMALASGQPSALLDWNNNYGDDPDKCVFFHCSNLPASFFGRKPKMCCQTIIAGSVGEENAYGTCEGPVAPGPFTFLRVDTDEDLGLIRAYTGAGGFTKDELKTFGGYGVAEIAGLQSLMHYICRGGFAHHVALNRSRVDDVIHEALAQYLNWDLYHHTGD